MKTRMFAAPAVKELIILKCYELYNLDFPLEDVSGHL